MNSREKEKFEAGKSAHQFAQANPLTDPGQVAVVDGLGADLARVDALFTQQRSGLLAVKSTVARRRKMRREAWVPLRQLVTVAESVAEEVPELTARFVLPPRGTSHQAFLTASRAMVAEAQVHREVFVKHGMAATLLEDLTATLDAYDKTIEERNAGRRAHVGARGDLRAVLGSVMARIAQLDAIYAYRFRGQPEQLSAWKNARDLPWPKDGQAPVNGSNGSDPVGNGNGGTP